MVDLIQLSKNNLARWQAAKVIRTSLFNSVAARLVAPSAKQRYQNVAKFTGVPWYFIAVAHERESSQNWNASLAQGDPWNKVSVHVPAGRGPFNSWEDAAIDALVKCPPYAAANMDWSIGGTLTMLERYNGLGYASRGLPSPYIWSGTDQYVKGKYVRDGVFDPNAVDQQLGCAGLLKAMRALDPSVMAGPSSVPPAVHPVPTSPPVAPTPTPQVRSFGDLLKALFSLFTKGK